MSRTRWSAPLADVYLCVEPGCEEVSTCSTHCLKCGNHQVMSLAKVLNRQVNDCAVVIEGPAKMFLEVGQPKIRIGPGYRVHARSVDAPDDAPFYGFGKTI